MVLKAARNGLSCTRSRSSTPSAGRLELRSLSDGWRSVRVHPPPQPEPTLLVPAAVVGLPALIGALALATGPVDVFGRTWQFNALCVCLAGVLLGTQIAQLGLVARTFGAAQLGDPDPLLSAPAASGWSTRSSGHGAPRHWVAILVRRRLWASDGYGALRHDHPALVGLALAASASR